MSILFQETTIRGLTLRNRFVRSATWEGMADAKGAPTEELIQLMGDLASGGVGLIITGYAFVSEEGRGGPRQLGIHSDELVGRLREMVREVHARGGRIVAQLGHCGIQAAYNLTGMEPIGPSPMEGRPGRGMTLEDIERVRLSFARAAKRAVDAGFDGVQIHAAHGYLLSQFLSPYFNKREDAYGGSLEGRVRLLVEVTRGIREEVGAEKPVLIKINCEDFLPGGLTLEDSVKAGEILVKEGIDAIEVSGGMRLAGPKFMPSRLGIRHEHEEAYFKEAAKEFKRKVGVPVILVGGIRSFQVAERLVEEGFADYISMSRPFIREPWLVNRWKGGDLRRAFCVSDNLCFEPAQAGEGIYCVTERRETKGE
jgi:2,4-dienoyl-CoA reductase-like NADH-dependent reductase (Old Yellow Enzyme family)